MIFRKGVEIEATVRTTWNHEVQVRTSDGELLWRTVKTAWLVTEAAKGQSEAVPPVGEGVVEGNQPDAPTPELKIVPEIVEVVSSPEMETESASTVEETHVEPSESVATEQPVGAKTNQPAKATRKAKKRRKGSGR